MGLKLHDCAKVTGQMFKKECLFLCLEAFKPNAQKQKLEKTIWIIIFSKEIMIFFEIRSW